MSSQVQHREIEVQTTPVNNSNKQSPKQNQSYFGNSGNIFQVDRHKQSDYFQDQTQDTNTNDFKSNTDTVTMTGASQAKKKCINCTTGPIYQKLKQQQIEVSKLKQQNDKLIGNLRQMGTQLDETLEKFKLKKNDKAPINQESAKIVNEQELENAKQQLALIQKQMDMYSNQDQEFNSQRMNQWAQQIKEVDYQLTEAKREQEKTMQSNKEGLKLKMLRDEVLHLKSLIREARRVAKVNEKGFKKTQEHTEKLRQRHEEVCKQFGVPFDPYESLVKQPQIKNMKQKTKDERVEIKIEDVKEEGKFHVLKINEENIFKLQQHLKILEDCIKTMKKQQKQDIKGKEKLLSELQKEKDEISQLIESRDREIKEAYDQFSNFKAIAQNSTTNLNGIKFVSENRQGKSSSLHALAPTYIKKYKSQQKNMKGYSIADQNQIITK